MRNTHKSILLLLTGIFCLTNLAHAQDYCKYPEQGTFVMKGKALNVPEGKTSFQIGVCHPFENQGYTIGLNKDGSFRKQLPITGIQDIYLYLGDAITCFSYPGDTLELTFDFNDCPTSVQLKGTTEARSKELQLNMELYHKFRKPFLDLSLMLRDSRNRTIIGADSTQIYAIKQYIDGYKETIEAFIKQQGTVPYKNYLMQRGYFDGLGFIAQDANALNTLFYKLGVRCYSGADTEKAPLYKQVSFDPFASPQALSFMYGYLSSQLDQATNLFFKPSIEKIVATKMQLAETAITDKTLRDWFCVNSYYLGVKIFSWSRTEGMKQIGEAVEKKITNPAIKAELSSTIDQVFNQLAKGKPAPVFTLPDDKGKPVSLKDLRGKIVYLDFWGDGCAPCIREFKEQESFHEKYKAYKDRIAYVYICLGSNESRWKELIKKYNLKGINLHATSFNDEAIAGYGVTAIPLYVLIDEEGNIIEHNTLRPSDMVKDAPNLLDEALKK